MRRLILTLVCALFVAGHAHAQDNTVLCWNGKKAAETSKSPQWHTTLAAGTSQPKLWQVGYLNALPTFDVVWRPVMDFAIPTNLGNRDIVAADLVVRAKAVEGGDVDTELYLLGTGLSDPKKLSDAALTQLADHGVAFESAYFSEGAAGAPFVFWVDELASAVTDAIERKEKHLTISMAPFSADGAPSTQVRFSSVSLKLYHCPVEK